VENEEDIALKSVILFFSQAIYSILIDGKEPTGVLKELFFRAVAYEFY